MRHTTSEQTDANHFMIYNPSKIIEFLMKRKGYETFQDLAAAIKVHPSTLSRQLSKLDKNRSLEAISEDLWRKLSIKLQIESAEMEAFMQADIGVDLSAHNSLVRAQHKLFKPLNDVYLGEIIDLTNSLNSGDCYTLISCFTPMEYYDPQLQTAIANAITRGAEFRYVYPSSDSERFREILAPYQTSDTRDCFHLSKMHEDHFSEKIISLGIEKEVLEEKVSVATSADPVLLSPFSKYIHLSRKVLGVYDTLVFSELRMGNFNDLSVLRYWYLLPRPDALAVHQRVEREFNS